MSIFQLINEIDNGEIVLPAIQRDFVWDTDRIEGLMDSLFRGYPVGIVLLWETYEPIQIRNFIKDYRGDTVHLFDYNQQSRRIKLVLDGQQRLSSLYIALKGSFGGKSLYFDVLSGRDNDNHAEKKFGFRFFTKEEADNLNATAGESKLRSHWLRFSELVILSPMDLIQLRRKLTKSLNLSDDCQSRLEMNLSTALHALSGNSELLKTQTIDAGLPAKDDKRKTAFDILEIFVRINTRGMALERSDLIASMLRLYWPAASNLLPTFLKEINEGSGLAINTDFVIRCMFSTAGLGTRLDFDLLRRRSNVDLLKASSDRCFKAIRAVVDFVRADCGIDSVRLLGGINSLVPFVHYLYNTDTITFHKSERADVRKAIFLFAFSRAFSQYSDSRPQAFIRDHLPTPDRIKAGDRFSFTEAIRFVSWKSGFEDADIRMFANNRDLALSLIQRRTGGKIFSDGNQPEIDHIFPKSELYDKGLDTQEINSLGNFWILPRKMNRNKSAAHPMEYLKDVADTTLAAALIDRTQLDYKLFKRFNRERQKNMVAELQKLTGIVTSDFEFLQEDDE
ncbi:GmrSD restriction endonuclease domain-containing protein [Novosphingobium sediminicola]|uniref:GmrSD restriction endonucleases N-terminal domain-containing protein n=1 Tax=Novosphingobium sediminicola TaxID=563162 RepID=A0A7W6G791_9SPHN|nr:DUF262 domain-containing protein [Novosphingobium sediminicola]MBB3955930.1 hypothetical protein [Novosphingobium sediminicola]